MSGRRVRLVARWEFLRFAKPKDLLISTLVLAAIYAVLQFVGDFARGRATAERTVVVLEAARLDLAAALHLDAVQLIPTDLTPAAADSLVLADAHDGALLPDGDGWQLRVRHDRGWQDLLLVQFGALVRQAELRRLELDPRTLALLQAPAEVRQVLVEPGAEAKRTGTLAVGLVVGVMLLGLFTGLSYVFVAITAEKTQRTTESLLSVLRPQEWIDGKILGLMGVVLVNLLSFVVAWFLWQAVSWLLLGRVQHLPGGLGGPDLALCILFAAGGFAFWFTLFALVAATIDDPNSSNRTGIMFLPFIPLSLVFAGLDAPDAAWMRILSLVPGVSPSAMPVRILRGDPAAWEILLSLALLAVGTFLLRRAAGRVFGTSMLMTGKEPGLREVWRWLKESA